VGFGTEILFVLMFGLLGHMARAKAQFEEASRGFKSQLAAELDAAHQDGKTDGSHEPVVDQ